MNEHSTQHYSGILDLKGFTRHAWRHGARVPIHVVMNDLGPLSRFGLLPDIRFAVWEVLVTHIGTANFAIDGQDFAKLADFPTYRACNAGDVSKLASETVGAGEGWGEAAVVAALAESCDLGYTAIAGAWGYGLLSTGRTDLDDSLPETGLPVPADEIAMLLGGRDPDTRETIGASSTWRAAVKKASSTAQNTVLLGIVAQARKPESTGNRRWQANLAADLMGDMPWVAPKVMSMLEAAFGSFVQRPAKAA